MKAPRKMERERKKGKLPGKGKTWEEVTTWARIHYGEEWYRQHEALDRDEQKEREAMGTDEWRRENLKAARHSNLLRDMQWERDEEMLAAGKTWHGLPSPRILCHQSRLAVTSYLLLLPTFAAKRWMGHMDLGGHMDPGTHGNGDGSGWSGTQFERVRLRRSMKKPGLSC